MDPDRAAVTALYERYLACCNERRFDELAGLVDEAVTGSAPVDGRAAYLRGVRAVVAGFPDYRWVVRDVVVEGGALAARLTGRGTHTGEFAGLAPTGRRVEVQELVQYRVADGRITHCWGDLFPVLRVALTEPGRADAVTAPGPA